MKLNVGSGSTRMDGYINADIDHRLNPDIVLDVTTPWPWDDGAIEEVRAIHVLEHLLDLSGFMTEAYRCMAPGASMHIAVPHPRSDYFLGDPTHVRPITAHVLQLYSRELNLVWQRDGFSNTPLALILNVDFHIISATQVPSAEFMPYIESDPPRLEWSVKHLNNVIDQLEFILVRV